MFSKEDYQTTPKKQSVEESKVYENEQKEFTFPSSSTNKRKVFLFLSLNETKEAQVALRALE